ncbi:hypothetical protein [Methanofollis fontis]|uniref:hypothetical protein n=1 Tax=Methanofollis fontis TaxID=2052832 RepID=UPI001A92AED6|nr:hypothetical protein [Methanofollis fontis]
MRGGIHGSGVLHQRGLSRTATDAVRAILQVAFDRFPICRLQAGVFQENRAS